MKLSPYLAALLLLSASGAAMVLWNVNFTMAIHDR